MNNTGNVQDYLLDLANRFDSSHIVHKAFLHLHRLDTKENDARNSMCKSERNIPCKHIFDPRICGKPNSLPEIKSSLSQRSRKIVSLRLKLRDLGFNQHSLNVAASGSSMPSASVIGSSLKLQQVTSSQYNILRKTTLSPMSTSTVTPTGATTEREREALVERIRQLEITVDALLSRLSER